jgi:hypothetical protein
MKEKRFCKEIENMASIIYKILKINKKEEIKNLEEAKKVRLNLIRLVKEKMKDDLEVNKENVGYKKINNNEELSFIFYKFGDKDITFEIKYDKKTKKLSSKYEVN